jgi:hypothetical protein
MTIPNDEFYDRYVARCNTQNIILMSKTYVIYNVLAKLKIHHSKDESLCNLCRIKDPDHLLIKNKQIPSYMNDKKKIASGQYLNHVLVIQDFSQIQIGNCGFYQDLVICFYFYDPYSIDKLGRKYFHFVGKAKQKHHEGFVYAVWEYMLNNKYFEKFINGEIHIWSDGGPKHFKLTSRIYNFHLLAIHYTQFTFIYNYFPSYHGHGICDTVVAQAKHEINSFQRIYSLSLQYEREIVQMIATIHNHFPISAPANKAKQHIHSCGDHQLPQIHFHNDWAGVCLLL